MGSIGYSYWVVCPDGATHETPNLRASCGSCCYGDGSSPPWTVVGSENAALCMRTRTTFQKTIRVFTQSGPIPDLAVPIKRELTRTRWLKRLIVKAVFK